MKTIIEERTSELKGYEELKEYERFIYVSGSYEFFAFKITERHSIFVNGCGRFIVAEKFKNCLSIWNGAPSMEFKSFDAAEEFIRIKEQ